MYIHIYKKKKYIYIYIIYIYLYICIYIFSTGRAQRETQHESCCAAVAKGFAEGFAKGFAKCFAKGFAKGETELWNRLNVPFKRIQIQKYKIYKTYKLWISPEPWLERICVSSWILMRRQKNISNHKKISLSSI